ncbi:sperm-associated antigen 5 [Neolamprologus brichardi]|uniref:sperm-associated antigen 5 n=1 Tax=Neolamprologus brichardi TaxID=32507 RepID=UPI0003EBC7B8|nr:sperm-associated antigen 5 [Neolamprologus brichardi]
MASRSSSSTGEGLLSSRSSERTPLRSLDNEILHLSTPSSKFRSKSQISSDAGKMTMGDFPLSEQEPQLYSSPSTKMIQTNLPKTDTTTTQIACGLSDITFKSFTCAGGEVEILGSLLHAEESLILSTDQGTSNTESEDGIISDSVIMESCSDHIEHPYHVLEKSDTYTVNISAALPCETDSTTPASCDLENKQATEESTAFQSDCSGKADLTWKSFLRDVGEVEVSDATRLHNETIPLPKEELGAPLEYDSINLTNCFGDFDQQCQEEHADHPYCSHAGGVDPVIEALSETTRGSEKRANGLTFKSLNCTGGEIEIPREESVVQPANHTVSSSETHGYAIDSTEIAGDCDLQNDNTIGHFDHPDSTEDVIARHYSGSPVVSDSQAGSQGGVTADCCIPAEDEKLDEAQFPKKKTSLLHEDQIVFTEGTDYNLFTSITHDYCQDAFEDANSQQNNGEAVVATDPSAVSRSLVANGSLKALDSETVKCKGQEMLNCTVNPADSALPLVVQNTQISDCSQLAGSAESPSAVEAQQQDQEEHVSEVNSTRGPAESSEEKDSAIGSSGNAPALCNCAEKSHAENLTDVLKALSECPSVASALQLGMFSPVRRASLSFLKTCGDPAQGKFAADDSAIEGEKTLFAPLNADHAGLWAQQLESPMPHPLLNSTALGQNPGLSPLREPVKDLGQKVSAEPQTEAEKPLLNFPLISDGPFQQQLRQMAEFLMMASGKMGPAAVSAPAPPPAPPAKATPVKSHSVCVGSSPVKLVDHSLNTSGLFERKREFSVADSCTMTDPLLWNLPPGSLESLPKQELEQRLMSSMTMVEALLQQLTAARAQGRPLAGPAPSDLREKLVQTDHTELSQTTMYRDLYVEALSRIGELELDGSSLQNLIQSLQDMKVTMTSVRSDTDAALSNMNEIGDIVREDHQSLISHYGHMKSLLEKSKDIQSRMMQKVKEALHQRNDMRTQMEEAFTAKEAAFSAMEQLRTHCATEISLLEKSVGSQQELLAALNQSYPELVGLNKAYNATLDSASDLLSETMDEQSALMKELFMVRSLLHKTAPMLLKLNEKAAAALRERDEHISARDQAVEEREQIEEELNETHSNFQAAREQIGDLNLQVTILTSEMGVLREKLTEKEEETGQLERKVTELSATVSSTLASYTFLEQALAAETTKLQESWKDKQEAKDRANDLEASLGQSEQRVCELSRALAQSEEQLSQLQSLSQSQSLQIQQLQDVCTQLSGVREMNEFLQMENELAREQMAESERMLRENLQSLRERNIQCEDLKKEVCQLKLENGNLQEELKATRSRARTANLELEEKMAQAVTEITLLHHTLRGLTNKLHDELDEKKPQMCEESQSVHSVERCASFVDSIMVASTAEREEEVKADTPAETVPSDTLEPQREALFSGTSAFTRIAAITPKKNMSTVEIQPEEEEQSHLAELLTGLGSTVTELVSTLKLVQQRRDAQLEELHGQICGLQVEQRAAKNGHKAEVFELKHQLSRLSQLVEKANQALQQKTQDEKTLAKLIVEVQDTQEILNKQKTDNNELRREITELRRALQQSKVESEFLRDELRKAGGQSTKPEHFMEENIKSLKEVERLKASLQEAEQAKVKILERAKRHQIIYQSNQQKSENELQILNNMINRVRETLLSLPAVVKNCEQLQQLVEYIG